MKINESKCTGCENCVPYCPVGAISMYPSMGKFRKVAKIDYDECVECSECQKCGVCPVDAHEMQTLEWPRTLRELWSNPLGVFPWTGIGGRGTQEMKTNDVSGRFADHQVGWGIELGRPMIGCRIKDAEKISVRLAKFGISYEPDSPWTKIIDPISGRLKYPDVGNEKVLSCILEFITPIEKTVVIWNTLMEVAEEIDTVFTVNIISKCKDGVPILKPILDEAGINVRINGKTNVGLGRPLIP
jgi:NAD-dependent dihydropyrimidine dehydrogenase PreA subunit